METTWVNCDRMLIGNRKVSAKVVNQLVEEIKKKKELRYLADSFVKENLRRLLGQEAKLVGFLINEFDGEVKGRKSKEFKQIVKKVRGELRKLHGLYEIEKEIEKRWGYLSAFTKTRPGQRKFLELHKKILETHTSSKERLDFYEKLYGDLFKITGIPKRILDLGSGINPFSIPLMKLGKLDFYAYDVDDSEIELIGRYFEYLGKVKKGFYGEVGVLDLRQWERLKKLKEVDVCFFWKTTDMVDRGKGHKASEQIIVTVPAKFVVVSFPTFTVTGKKMNYPRRKWIELMCKRLGYEFKIIKEKNEIFYVVGK